MKTYALFLVYICLLAKTALAQSNPRLNPGLDNVIPPSPNAAALAKFTDIQVGPSTGIPQINVPIYKYENEASGLRMNVSLDYHAGGVRVDEMASNIGAGWALNAGGVISRTLRGIPDESTNFGFIKYSALTSDETSGNSGSSECDRLYMRIYNDVIDGQNDIFNFNFIGRNGKFVYGKNNDFLMLTSQKVKVEKAEGLVTGVPGNSIKQFIITDEVGIKYFFDALEVSACPWIKQPNNSIYVSSWYLTKIQAPSGKDSITLEYENYEVTYNISISASMSISLNSSWQNGPYSQSIIGQTVKGKRIKKINFPNNITLSFTYNTAQRSDLAGDYALQKIILSDGVNQRGYKLVQDYSINRLTLKNVTPIVGVIETEDKGYTFEYSSSLPARLSYQQDHWGFYNSNTVNTFFPVEYVVNPSNPEGYMVLPGGDRSTDTSRVKAGSLKTITYPTGGSTVFDLEANTAEDERLDHNLSIMSKQRSASISFNPTTTNTNFPFQGDPNSPTHIKISFMNDGQCPGGVCYVTINVKDNLGNLVNSYSINIISSSPQNIVKEYDNSNYTSAKTYTISCQTTGLVNFYSWINVQWDETRILNPVATSVGNKEMYVGGLRARRIYFYDNTSSNPSIIKEYSYTKENGTTSGTLGVYPTYTNDVCYGLKPASVQTDSVETYTGGVCYKSRNGSPVIANVSVNGSSVIYKRVVEKQTGQGGPVGRIERYFTSFSDIPLITMPFPYGPPHYNEWNYGLLTKELVYKENDTTPIKKTENTYLITTGDYYSNPTRMENFKSLTLAPVKYRLQCGILDLPACSSDFWGLVGPCPLYFKVASTFSYPGRSDIEQTVISEYDKNGNVIRTTKNYEYNGSNYYLSKQTDTNSKGEQIVSNYTHPAEMISAGRDNTGVYQEMLDNNILAPVIETVTKKGATDIKTSRTNYYKAFAGVFKPQTVIERLLNQSENTLFEYKQFNNNGQLLSGSRYKDVNISYIWSKRYAYPVAKVVGSDYTTIITKINQGIIDNPSNDQTLLSELNKLRSITGTLVTTYTYMSLFGMTSETDPAGKTTYYEYDGQGRLLRIRDMDGNIIKQFEYQYQGATGCGSNCSILAMTTLAGTNTIGYPVGVFNANGKLLGNATNQSQYLSLWNADTANAHRGTLAAGADPLHFQFTLIPGKTIPAITGCRYFQYDLAWNNINAIRNSNGAYIDFGDGTGMRLAAKISDSLTVLAPNTTQAQAAHPEWNGYAWYFVHTYPDNSVKTLTFYHNDASESSALDNNGYPATSLTYLRNLRGNLPQYMQDLGGSSYQDASALTVAGITNWNTIHSIKGWGHGSGDAGVTTTMHMGYPQDFMAGNRDLEAIGLCYPNYIGCFDSTFRISRLKSDWNTYFTHLKSLFISDAHWNREDLSALKELNSIYILPARQKYTNDPTNNPQLPIPAAVIDNIYIQVAAGAGQTVSNGVLTLYTAGTTRTSASDAAVSALLAKGWTLNLNGVQLH